MYFFSEYNLPERIKNNEIKYIFSILIGTQNKYLSYMKNN
jgi:hypothetical protein